MTKILTDEEELELFKEYEKTGSPRLKAKLVSHFKPLVLSAATGAWKRAPKLGPFEFEDFHQEALIGLIMAIDRFQYERGLRFSGYARPWVEGKLSKFVLQNCYNFKMGYHHIQRINELNQQHVAEMISLGEDPSQIEIDITQLSLEHSNLINMLKPALVPVDAGTSFDPEDDDGVFDLEDLSVDTEGDLAVREEMEWLHRAIEEADLTDRERDIIKHRFQCEEATLLQTLADKHGITKERTRQIQKAAIRKIRRKFHERTPPQETS